MEQTPTTPQPPEQPPQPPSTAAETPSTTPSTSTAAAASSSSPLPPATTSSLQPPSFATSNPNPTATQQARPPFNTRPWQQPYSHFSLPSPPLPSSSTSSPSVSAAPTPPRGGIAIGVPAHHPATPTTPTPFSSLSSPYSQPSQIRQPMQGIRGLGVTGSLGTASTVQPVGHGAHQLRPAQASFRPQASPNNQPSAAQNIQGHGMLRGPALGSPSLPSPSGSQTQQTQNQPWLSSANQARPPLPSPSLRPQASQQSLQQRSHLPQQHLHAMSTTLQQQQTVSSPQQPPQPSTSGQTQEHYGKHFTPSRIQQPPQQQQMVRAPGLASQRPNVGLGQSGAVQPGPSNKTTAVEPEESSNRIVSKRSIQELLSQINPSEKLDPEVEDILVDIAEDFVESITTFGCSLAKHRKSTTLEAKDILLHLERNWNMTLPGFGGDEIKVYKKPFVSDIHKERLAAVKRSASLTEVTNKNLVGASGGNTKSHAGKGTAGASIVGSPPPNPKTREVA